MKASRYETVLSSFRTPTAVCRKVERLSLLSVNDLHNGPPLARPLQEPHR